MTRKQMLQDIIGLRRSERLALTLLFALGLVLGWLDSAAAPFGR
ncbi:MAG: hypothetical protein O2782_00820 [bacterium]|nr:hypothetical protein [bacterium]